MLGLRAGQQLWQPLVGAKRLRNQTCRGVLAFPAIFFAPEVTEARTFAFMLGAIFQRPRYLDSPAIKLLQHRCGRLERREC
jgi:hypothetical protein